MDSQSLLEVHDLKTYFDTVAGVVHAVDGVSLSVAPGETIGIVGESGCGKSVTSLAIMRLIKSPPGKIVGGRILFEGEDLLKKSEAQMRVIRGNSISMIFQDPMTSFNPTHRIKDQISEAITLHQHLSKKIANQKSIEMLKMVGIPSAEKRADDFPHQLSGGMCQRAMIAMALSCNPKLLIADEPTTALDVTIQAQVLDLMKSLQSRLGMAIMLITHDLGVVAEQVQRVVIMYAGEIVEQADTHKIFRSPQHPYTRGLIKSIPRVDQDVDRLVAIKGVVPKPFERLDGCRFQPRCNQSTELCQQQTPELLEINPGHRIRCWNP